MTLTYVDTDYTAGKTSENSDVVQAKFLELIEDKRIVQQIEFESEDSAFAGRMNMSWNLRVVSLLTLARAQTVTTIVEGDT